MTREWKPGDVAAFTVCGKTLVCIRDMEGLWTGYRYGYSWVGRPWDGRHNQRPLVVIDPEDREQVERLCDLMWARGLLGSGVGGRCTPAVEVSEAQVALREFADPKPARSTVVSPEQVTALVKQVAIDREESPYWSARKADLDAVDAYLGSLADHLGVSDD